MPSQAPSVVVADNTPGPAFRVPIVCKGHRASLYIEGSGDVVYEPQELSPTALDFDCNCLRSNAERKVFLKHDVVGATLEGEGQVRIWYCSPSHTTRGGHTKTRYSLQKSDRFEFPERQAAQRFVQETQAAVSWWGRKQPPRVVAIVNPVSGRGSGASIFSRQVLPVLRDAAGLVLEVHTTRHRGHASEIVARLDLQQVDLILYVGGDGTVFEGMQVGAEAMYFMLHNTQYIALNARLNPQGRLADGLWDLITVSGLKGWSGTASAIELLLKSETGDHVSLDFVRTQRVRALMLEQLPGAASWTVLDGESVPNQPLFLEVHRQAATILTAPDWVDI